eukprot:668641-Pyramimonas_sp.AAC.1
MSEETRMSAVGYLAMKGSGFLLHGRKPPHKTGSELVNKSSKQQATRPFSCVMLLAIRHTTASDSRL